MAHNPICAYCGRPLQTIAGFCVACQAPVDIALRAKLVARAMGAPSAPLVGMAQPLPPVALRQRPARGLTRLFLGGGIIALILVLAAVSAQLHFDPIRAFIAPTDGELSVSLAGSADAVTTVAVGVPFTLRYGATVQTAWSVVTLTIAPQYAPARALTERWPRGISQRQQTLVATQPDTWRITVRRDATVVRQMDLTITAATSMTKESSRPTSVVPPISALHLAYRYAGAG